MYIQTWINVFIFSIMVLSSRVLSFLVCRFEESMLVGPRESIAMSFGLLPVLDRICIYPEIAVMRWL